MCQTCADFQFKNKKTKIAQTCYEFQTFRLCVCVYMWVGLCFSQSAENLPSAKTFGGYAHGSFNPEGTPKS